VKVSAGEYHAQALTDENELFTWGTYKDPGGYLGYAPGIDVQKTPRLVDTKYFQGLNSFLFFSFFWKKIFIQVLNFCQDKKLLILQVMKMCRGF
jgi:hypothetical protein